MELHKRIIGNLRGLGALLAVCGCPGCGSADPSLLPEEVEGNQAELRDRTKPTTPANLRITDNTSYSVSLAWNPSTDNSGNLSYRVRHSWGYEVTVAQTQTSFTWTTNLEPRSTYYFVVYAVDAAGNKSSNSNTVTIRMPNDTIPPATPTLSVTDLGPTHATFLPAATDDGPYVWYTLFRNGVSIVQMTREIPITAYLLEPATTYGFAAQSRDFGGNLSAVSSPITVTTPPADRNDVTPPSVPANVNADFYSNDAEITMRWTASTDDTDAQAFIRYDTFVNGVLSDIAVGRTRSIVYGVDGTNIIEVVARDSAGNVSAPATVTVVLDL
jgi:Fibronectin type III domain